MPILPPAALLGAKDSLDHPMGRFLKLTIVDGDLLDRTSRSSSTPEIETSSVVAIAAPGVSGAIKRRAGTEPFRELARKGPIPLGWRHRNERGPTTVSRHHPCGRPQSVLVHLGARDSRLRRECAPHRPRAWLSLCGLSAHRSGHGRILSGAGSGRHAGRSAKH
jgi:hypothetical protein